MGLAQGGSGLDLAALEDAPHGLDLGPLRPSLLDRIETPDQRIACLPEIFADDLGRLASAATGGDDDELLLIGRRDARSNNSWMHNAPRLVKGKPRDQLLVHPEDLAARGIADGARVRVRSGTGSVEVEASASSTMMRGVVCLPHGYGHDRAGVRMARAQRVAGPSYNDLSDPARLDGPSGNAALNGLPVRIESLA
jgi:anaerobic selenocysteine-containing dehydrogenase